MAHYTFTLTASYHATLARADGHAVWASNDGAAPTPGTLYGLWVAYEVVALTYRGVRHATPGSFLAAYCGTPEGAAADILEGGAEGECEPPAPYTRWCRGALDAIGLVSDAAGGPLPSEGPCYVAGCAYCDK